MAQLAPWEQAATKEDEVAPWEQHPSGMAGPAPWDTKPTVDNVHPAAVADQDDSSAFVRGIKAYAPQTKELWNAAKVITGAGIQKLAGEGDFSHDMIANGLKGMEEAKKEEEPLQAKVAWNDSVNGFITEYLPYMVGQGVANAGESLLSAGVGAGLGAFFGGVGAIPGGLAGIAEKQLVKQGVKKLAEEVAEKEGTKAGIKFVADSAKKLMLSKGSMLGMATQAAFHGVGEPGSRAIEEIQNKNPNADIAQELNFTKLAPAMAIHAGADFLSERFGLGALSGLDAAGKNLLYDVAKVYAASTAKEIPPELAQQWAERFGAGLDTADLDAMKEYIETVVGTFVQGIPMSGLGGIRGYLANNRIRNQIADIVKPDFVAQYGKEPTKEELSNYIDKHIEARNKIQEEQNAAGNTGDNTGVTQPGIPTSEGITSQRGTEPGLETNAQSNVVGSEQPADQTGRGTQPSTAELNTEQVGALQPKETQEQETFESKPARVNDRGAYLPSVTKGQEPLATAGFKVLDEDNDLSDDLIGATMITGMDVANRNKGAGTKLLSAITNWADTNDKTLVLVPAAQPDASLGGLNQEQLKDWYARNGFEDRVDYMVRVPNQEQTKETPSEEEQAALQDELDQELNQNQEPTDEEIADKLLEQSQLEEEQRKQDEEELGEPTPEQVETEQEAKKLEPMSSTEEKLRHISQTPRIEELPADLQNNPIVQQYHDLFNQAVAIGSGENIDREAKAEVTKKLQELKPQLPVNHPARIAMGKTEQQLKKGLDKKEKKSKSSSPKVQNADINTLEATVHPVVDDAIRSNDFRGALKGIVRYGGEYFSKLADRLLGLNFTVNIGYDITNKVLENFLSHTAVQRNQVEAYLQLNYHHIWDRYFNEANFDPSINPILLKAEAYNRLMDGRIRVPNKSLMEQAKVAYKSLDEAVGSLAAAGFYYEGSIALNNSLNGGVTTNYVLMHESTHAAVSDLMLHPEKLNPEQRRAYYNLVALYHNTVKQLKGTPHAEQYGLLNLHEFIAEAFSNRDFQKILRSLYAENKTNQSTWSKFIQYISKLIGVDNVLFQTMANTDVLFSAREESTTNVNTFNPGTAIPQNSISLDNTSKFEDEKQPKIAKSIAAKKGKFRANTAERTGMLGTIGDLIRSHTPWSKVNKRKFVSNLASVREEYRRALLGALTLDQLSDLVGDNIPQFKDYVKEVDAMIYTRNKILAEGDTAIKLWSQLIQSNPDKAQQLHEVMLNATIDQIEADTTGPAHDAANWHNVDKRFKDAWNKMVDGTEDGRTALKIYREVRDFYKRRMDEYIAIQAERTRARLKSEGFSEKEINDELVKLKNNIAKDALKIYFPLKRFGEFWLQTGKGKSKTFQQFETAGARDDAYEQELERLIKKEKGKSTFIKGTSDEEVLRQVEENGDIQAGNNFSEILNSNLSDWAHLESLKSLVDKSTEDILGSSDAKVLADPIGALRDQVKDQLGQMYLELMPNESIRKMFMHRENIPGASIDMLRAFEVSRLRMAYQRSRFEHLPQLFTDLRSAQVRLKSLPAREALKYRDYVHELELNLKTAILNPPKQSGIVTALNQFGFINFLTAPASFMINLLGVGGVWAPAANARYGLKNTASAFAKFNRMLGGTGFVNETSGRYEFLSLARANMEGMDVKDKNGNSIGKTYADVYQDGVRRGTIDVTLSHEAAQIGEKPSNQYTGRWNKIMYYASLPFHASEKYMRETTFMATFELAYNKALDAKTHDGKQRYTAEQAYQTAIQEADALVKKTLFNYNTTNKPRYFRGNYRNILLQFKMYPQQMTVLMFRTLQKSLGDGMQAELIAYEREMRNSPHKEELMKAKIKELESIKREARDQFLGMMGMAFLTSGMTGLPFWFIFSGIASAFHAAFGDSDEPFDAENWFKNWCFKHLGGFTGEILSRGALSTVSGLNFADRMSTNLPDLWFQDVRKGKDDLTTLQNTMMSLLGPSAGALVTYAEALDRFNQGHTERAIETAMPSAIKNVMTGLRYLSEGQALTMKGDTLMEEVPARLALAQMLGFTPDKIAQAQKANIEMKNAEQEIIARHNDLLNAFFIALDSGDTYMMDKVIAKIVHFSQTNPGKAITPDALTNSIKTRYKNRALSNITGGMGIDKRMIPQLEGWRNYANEE